MTPMTPMTAEEYAAVRQALGLEHSQMAELLHVDVRSSRRWESGERKVHNPMAMLLRAVYRSLLKPEQIETLALPVAKARG